MKIVVCGLGYVGVTVAACMLRRGATVVGIDLNLRCFGPRFDHLGKNLALLRRIAFHSVDEIGDEIGPALILVLHLAPGGLGGFLLGRDRVDSASGKHDRNGDQQGGGAASGRPAELW